MRHRTDVHILDRYAPEVMLRSSVDCDVRLIVVIDNTNKYTVKQGPTPIRRETQTALRWDEIVILTA